MTSKEIDEMPAGRELDALVAEKVMGWYVVRSADDVPSGYEIADGHSLPGYRDGTFVFTLPRFRTDIASAWQVIGRLEKDYDIRLYNREDGYWIVIMGKKGNSERQQGVYITVQEGICKVALKVFAT